MTNENEVDKNEFKEMQQTLNLLLQGEKQRQEEAAKLAEKQKMEQLKQDIKNELEEELTSKFTEAATLASKTVIEESLGKLLQDRTHVRPSLQQNIQTPVEEGLNGVVGELKLPHQNQTSVKQKYNDPANYPAVMNGNIVQAVTAAELLGVNQ